MLHRHERMSSDMNEGYARQTRQGAGEDVAKAAKATMKISGPFSDLLHAP